MNQDVELPSLFDSSNLSLSTTRCWWIIHTRPRCEKKMDAWFTAQGMDRYLPTRPKKRSYPGKTVTFQHPLFPCYAFGSFSLLERNAVYGSGHAAAVLEVVEQKQFLHELEQIRHALHTGLEAKDCAYLSVGKRARVTVGKLRGFEGIVLRGNHKTRLVLSVEMLQRSVAVEIDPAWLEPLG
jgi:transcription antitermination factor NusG